MTKLEQPDLAKFRRMAADLGFKKPVIVGETSRGPVCVMQIGEFYAWDRFADGSIGNECVFRNMATTVGLNSMGDVYFRNQTQLPSWYGLIINNSGYTGVAAGDTMGSHGGWTEFQSFDEATRPQWSPDASASGVLINSTVMTFTPSSGGQAKGFALASNSTKGGNTGVLWATAVEDSARTLTTGVPFQSIYQNTLASVS